MKRPATLAGVPEPTRITSPPAAQLEPGRPPGWLVSLFPEGVATAALGDLDAADPLPPEEEACIAGAAPRRRREFAAGRTCARRALGRLGLPAVALPPGPERAPRWPAGAVGSITHTRTLAAAVVGPCASFAGLGLDMEAPERVRPRLWRRIASPREIAWLEDAPDDGAARVRAALLFSAKEAFFKAQFGASGAWLGFHDAHVVFEPDLARFELVLDRDVAGLAAAGARFAGRAAVPAGHVAAGLAIAREASPAAPARGRRER